MLLLPGFRLWAADGCCLKSPLSSVEGQLRIKGATLAAKSRCRWYVRALLATAY